MTQWGSPPPWADTYLCMHIIIQVQKNSLFDIDIF